MDSPMDNAKDSPVVQAFSALLNSACPMTVLACSTKSNNIRFQLRVSLENTSTWIKTQELLEIVGSEVGFGVDNSKHYFTLEGERRWAWRLILQSDAWAKQLPYFIQKLEQRLAQQQQKPPVELTEFPLHANPNRHRNVRPTV